MENLKQNASESLTFVFADDHPLYRKSLVNTFQNIHRDKPYKYLEAANGREVLEHVKNEHVDIVFTDIGMPEMDGLECLYAIKETHPDCKVILISQFDESAYVQQAVTFGASGYVLKNADVDELMKCFELVLMGQSYFGIKVVSKLVDKEKVMSGKIGTGVSAFTAQQIKVLKLLCENMSIEEIADYLKISVSTVKTYKKQLYELTGSNNALGLMHYAIKHNIFNIK